MAVEPAPTTNEQNNNSRSACGVCENLRVEGQLRVVRNPLNITAPGKDASVRANNCKLRFSEIPWDLGGRVECNPMFFERVLKPVGDRNQRRIPVLCKFGRNQIGRASCRERE